MKAYRIVNWKMIGEVTDKGRAAQIDTPDDKIRKTKPKYIRRDIQGHSLSPAQRRLSKKAWLLGPMMDVACDGLYGKLLDLAGVWDDPKLRGWVLDDRKRPMNPHQVADLFEWNDHDHIVAMFDLLCDPDIGLLEKAEFTGVSPTTGESGEDMGGWGEEREDAEKLFLNETETEDKVKDNLNETEGGEFESQGAGGEMENMQPQALPAALASVSVPDSGPASVSAAEQPTATDSDSVPDTDSVSQPGQRAGPGAEDWEPLTDKGRLFEIRKECKKATLELSQIIHPHNTSDLTTINDIYTQLQQRMIAGSPYPLFELSINTARQCWRADKPIAMFVAAMKKPPFYYVPKKLSVVPGKFSRDRYKH